MARSGAFVGPVIVAALLWPVACGTDDGNNGSTQQTTGAGAATSTGGSGATGGGGGSAAPVCGDNVCDDTAGESCESCPLDCGTCCGNGSCDANEVCGTCESDCGSCTGGDIDVVRGPYLQRGSTSETTVRWRTANETASVVAFGLAPDKLSQLAVSMDATTEHVVVMTGLAADTRYYYAFGTPQSQLLGGDDKHFVVTPPPTGTAKPTRIWAIGDSGTANTGARNVRDAYFAYTGKRGTDLWLMLGDNAYGDGTDSQYQKAVFNMYPSILRNVVLWSTMGNHDGHSADSGTQTGPYYDIFTFPTQGEAGGIMSGTEAYYAFDYGNIHFVCLDSYDSDTATDGDMMTWLKNDLAANNQPWLIAFFHHPPYTKGTHNSDGESRLENMRVDALPILEQHGVDLVLCGHSHVYERSYYLNGHYGDSSTLNASMKVDDGDGRVDGDGAYTRASNSTKGAVYIVAGSSGSKGGGPLNHPAMFASLNELGSVVIDVDGAIMSTSFIDDNGDIQDWFTIDKN